jgi:hypothetical protein
MEHIISAIIIRRVRFVLLRVGISDSVIDTGGECRAITVNTQKTNREKKTTSCSFGLPPEGSCSYKVQPCDLL